MKKLLALTLLGALGACSAATVQRDTAAVAGFADQVQAACANAVPLAVLASGLPTVGPFIAAGVQVGCSSAGVAKLVADPSSVDWLTQQAALLKQALGKAP